MSLIGQFQAKLDSKNRVFLPAAFRRALQSRESGSEQPDEITVIIRRDFFENCLVIYPVDQWRREVDKVRARLNRFDNAQQMVYRKMVSEALELSLDANGRILIPQVLLDKVGISQDILFVGNVIPMMTNDGRVIRGTVKEIASDTVKMDFNHELAGATLHFTGEIIAVREATEKELMTWSAYFSGSQNE